MMASPVFLYGTLMEGGRLAHMLPDGVRYPAVVHGLRCTNTGGAYPVILPAPRHIVR
jgi:gamma-glutamylcyclotransferase (GGCT)/AIG2-like uncharacterized protein YtfP